MSQRRLNPFNAIKMSAEQSAGSVPYPTVDEVLNKLKYNGTFDYFRKTCLESIEAEVSLKWFTLTSSFLISTPTITISPSSLPSELMESTLKLLLGDTFRTTNGETAQQRTKSEAG